MNQTRTKKLLNEEGITEYIQGCLDSIKLNIHLAKIGKKFQGGEYFSFWIVEAEKELEDLLNFIKN